MTWRLFVTKARNSCHCSHCCFRYRFVGPFVCVLNCYLSVSVLLRCFSVWNNELLCYYYSVGTSQGNKLIRSCSGKSQPQSSYLAEPLWTYPGLKSGIGVRELISSLKKIHRRGWIHQKSSPRFSYARKKPPTRLPIPSPLSPPTPLPPFSLYSSWRIGTDTKIKVPPAETPELSIVPLVGQSIVFVPLLLLGIRISFVMLHSTSFSLILFKVTSYVCHGRWIGLCVVIGWFVCRLNVSFGDDWSLDMKDQSYYYPLLDLRVRPTIPC